MMVRNFATRADIFSHSDTSVIAMAMCYAVRQVSIKSAAVQVSKISSIIPPPQTFVNIQRIYCVALPKAYIPVRFWQRVSAVAKHRCTDRMSVVPCSIEFFIRKTRSKKMYKDVHFFAMVSVPLLKILNVSKIRLRYFFAYLLVSTLPIYKRLTARIFPETLVYIMLI